MFTDRKYTLDKELRHRVKDLPEEAGRKTTLELTIRGREDEGGRKEMVEKKGRIKIRIRLGEMTGRS